MLLTLGLAAFVAYIYLFNVDIPHIIATLQQIDAPVYVLAAIFAILNVFFFSLSWHSLLNFLSVKLSVTKSFLYVWYGIFVDAVIPGESISGEVSKLYLITREDSTVSGKVVASLVAERLMGMGVNLTSLLVGVSILLVLGQASGLVLNITVFLVIGLSIMLALLASLCVKEKWTLKIVDGVIRFVEYISRGRWKLTKIKEEATTATRMFHVSMKEFKRAPKTILVSTSFNALSWVLDLVVVYLVFLSVRYYSIHWGIVIVTVSILVAIKSVPIGIPFEAGLPEIAMSSLFIWLGVPAQTSFTVTILSRLLTMWLRFFIGFAVQQWIEIKQVKTTDKDSKMFPIETEKA